MNFSQFDKINNMDKWQLNDEEIAHYSKKKGLSSEVPLKVHVPKVMPKISGGYPIVTCIPNNSMCYCNASECKPPVSTTIQIQNFLSLQRYNMDRFKHKYFLSGATIKLAIWNGDVDNMLVTNRIDSSTCDGKCLYHDHPDNPFTDAEIKAIRALIG